PSVRKFTEMTLQFRLPARAIGHQESVRGRSPAVHPKVSGFWATTMVVGGLELNNAPADADRHRLGAVAGSQLFHDVLDVDFHGSFREEGFVGCGPVGVSPSPPPQDFDLTPT